MLCGSNMHYPNKEWRGSVEGRLANKLKRMFFSKVWSFEFHIFRYIFSFGRRSFRLRRRTENETPKVTCHLNTGERTMPIWPRCCRFHGAGRKPEFKCSRPAVHSGRNIPRRIVPPGTISRLFFVNSDGFVCASGLS